MSFACGAGGAREAGDEEQDGCRFGDGRRGELGDGEARLLRVELAEGPPPQPAPTFTAILVTPLLFTLQHYWQPYNYPLLILIQLPLVYVVWRKQNIYLGILTHCAGNLIGVTLSLVSFLGAS